MRFSLLTLVLVAFCAVGQSQTPQLKLPDIIGPSPNAASIQKYGDYKVSTYTGVPGIVIPIYDLKLRDIDIPVSISYHGGGIKVTEEASRVGLGWTLNAGGVITRNVLGMDDLWPEATAPIAVDLNGFPERSVISVLKLPFGGFTYDMTDKVGANIDNTYPYIDVDEEPDDFSLNLMGRNEKFILRRSDRTAILQDPSTNTSIKVNVTSSGIGTFTVTTSDGTIYNFNQYEQYRNTGAPVNIPTHLTAWYLTQITTTRGSVVRFNYTLTPNTYVSTMNHITASKVYFGSQDTSAHLNATPRGDYTYLTLDSITSSAGTVSFQYDTRIDLLHDSRLTGISVKDSVGSLVRRFNLLQDYFVANAVTGNVYDPQTALWGGPQLDSNWLSRRLKLTGIQELSPDGSLSQTHQFYYNESLLPMKNSTSVDHWGFFNNAQNGTNLLPDIYWAFPGLITMVSPPQYQFCSPGSDFGSENRVFIPTSQQYYMHHVGANKEIDTNYSQAFVLNKIVYPTGGYTQFKFEQNTYDKKKSFINDAAAAQYDYALHDTALFFVTGMPGIPSGFSQSFQFSVTPADMVPGDGVAIIRFTFKALKGTNNSSSNTNNTVIKILGPDGSTLLSTSFNSYSSLTNNGDGTYSPPVMNGRFGVGTYTAQITYGANVVDANSVYYTLIGSWPRLADRNTDGPLYKLAGGLRIKNISSYTSSGVLATSVDYMYHFTADSNGNGIPEIYSTGKLMDRPRYFDGTWAATPNQFIIKSEATVGVDIGYDSVVTLQNSVRRTDVFNNTPYRANIYTTYYSSPGTEMMPSGYASFPDVSVVGAGLPGDKLTLYTYFDYKPDGVKEFRDNANGKLLRSIDYSYEPSNSSYRVIRKVENSYLTSGTGTGGIIWADRMYGSPNGMFYNCLYGLPPIYGLTNFFYPAIRTEANLLLSSTTTEYSGTDSIVNVANYQYNAYSQLAKSLSKNSKGVTKSTEVSYPGDYSTTGDVLQDMRNRNMVDVPIEQISKTNNMVTGGIYNLYASHDNMVTPNKVYALDINAPVSLTPSAPTNTMDSRYSTRMVFSYNADGNLVTAQKFNDVNNAYIWDYARGYPIAEVQNAAVSDVAYTSFEADGTGGWIVPGSTRVSGAITGRKSYSLAIGSCIATGLNSSTVYIVSYWSNSGQYAVQGSISSLQGRTVNGWTYFEHKVTGVSAASVTGGGNIDELRLYPSAAQMTTYTYDPLIGTTSQCDINNRITYYEYDGLGRLRLIKDQDGNIIKTLEYHYKNQ